jgi:hypothetical protein
MSLNRNLLEECSMARMYPQALPSYVESRAERLLYEQFEQQLPDDFIVMYGVKWLIRDRSRYDRDGEIDFLVVHPRLGILVLEVKGGGIRVDGETGQWTSIDRYGNSHVIKNPFDQARSNLYNLMTKLEEAQLTRPFHQMYRIQRAIALPDIVVGSNDIGLYGDREIIIDSTDIHSLDRAVRRVMSQTGTSNALSSEAVNALVRTLQPTMEIRRLGLGTMIVEAEREIARLTEEQFRLLDFLQNHPRVAIGGCAGSGKTMLAVEKARRLANEGFQVLFVCFNKHLAYWVRRQFNKDSDPKPKNVTVGHFHDVVDRICKRARITLPYPPEDKLEADRYFSEIMPEKMLEALELIPDRYDAIIVDEGQDFDELWLYALNEALRDRDGTVESCMSFMTTIRDFTAAAKACSRISLNTPSMLTVETLFEYMKQCSVTIKARLSCVV